MAIKPSGTPLSLSEIQTEFGGTNPISLNEYYRGGGLVPNGPSQNANIATSGAINMGAFYGAVKAFQFNPTISANTTNYNLRDAAVAAGWDQTIPLQATVTINSGIYVSASSTGVYAFDTGASFPAGSSLSLVNNGLIVGAGGAGGKGGGWSAKDVPSDGAGGSAGGPALRAQAAISITNNGTIGGGGGGGGGGQNLVFQATKVDVYYCGGGGGGGGRSSAAVNAAGGAAGGGPSFAGGAGGTGTVSSQGGGGAGGGTGSGYAGSGGGGGGWGASGGSGGNNNLGWNNSYTRGPYGGGGAGAAVAGNGNISWAATGTRLGAIT